MSLLTLLLLLLLFLLLFLLGQHYKKKINIRLHRFKSGRDKIWQDCSSGKYGSIGGGDFST